MNQNMLFITEPIVTTKEAAKILNVTVQTVLKYEKEGKLSSVYKENWKQFGCKMFYEEEVKKIVQQNQKIGYTTKEVADLLEVAPSTVFNYIKEGKLQAEMVKSRGKEVYLIKEENIENFISEYDIKAGVKERKTFIKKVKDIDVHLFQLCKHKKSGDLARVIKIAEDNIKVLTEDEKLLDLEEILEQEYEVKQFEKRPVITKRGFITFTFKRPQLFHSITYKLIELFYQQIGYANMRLTLKEDSIEINVKPCMLQIDTMQYKEEIEYLHAHMTHGSMLPHKNGIILKSNLEPLSFYVDHTFKKRVKELANQQNMGLEEYLHYIVNEHLKSPHV
ncbi:helix-turn-helix domain-containing protein (plasmid) [Bacillus mycoides]|nr:helix-turn-helix domain-containing protein [Bacillus mycoides]